MAAPATANDSVRLQLSGSDVVSMRVAGALPGVVVLFASAQNGVGEGILSASAGGLSWQAPFSEQPGATVPIPTDGVYMLEDNLNPSAWVRVQAYVDYLPTSGAATIEIGDSYSPAALVAGGDVSATQAAAGQVVTTEYALTNVSAAGVTALTLWIDPFTTGITVSSDGTNFYDPTSQSDPNALVWATLAAGASVNVWVRRTIAADSAFNPQVLNVLDWAWMGE
jgi:hypothetical protein